MRPAPNYLKRTGYRLPTEAEWEFGNRAGASTSRYYGSSVELLPRYAWYSGNSQDRTWPVGQKRPNDLGLFDMHGNVLTWCQDITFLYPSGLVKDRENIRDVTDRFSRVLRGASFVYHVPHVRSAFRFDNRPANRSVTCGVRVSRALP
jgi:formylglycine-generating enzyme required for sulfatase activity